MIEDLLRLDADVRRAASRLAAESRELETAEGRARARLTDPFDGVRHVAGQTTYRELAERTPGPHELLHKDALLRWIHELLQARVGRDLALEDAERAHAIDAGGPALARPEGRAALSFDPSTSAPAGSTVAGDSYVSSWRLVLVASDAERARVALARAAELAAPVAAVRRERRARRAEVARRLGLAHPSALAKIGTPDDDPSGAGLARAWLDATEPLASALHKTARRRNGGDLGPEETLLASLARDVVEGWPARLTTRWFEDVFRGAVVRSPDGVRFPEVLGGASFLRAAYAFGRSLREQGTARSLPFALARDPYAHGAHRFGALFACALAEPLLHVRALGVSRRVATDQTRSLRASLFLRARTLAARVLLAGDETTDGDRFEEITMRVFGAPLPIGLRDAWPSPAIDDRARLAAACAAHAMLEDVIARFDEDWFSNPKAGAHLASVACGPLAEPIEVAPEVVTKAARAAEEALG